MKIVDFSIRRPVSVFIYSVAAVVFGFVALERLATDLLPDITYPSLTVRTGYQGAAPIEVENLVTRPVENAVGVVNGVVKVSSSSRADVSEVTLELGWGTDMDLAALDVRERLDILDLPIDVDRPLLLRYDPSLDPILRLAVAGSDDLIRLRLLADEEIKRTLERLEGVAAVVVSGGLEEELQVLIDEQRLSSLGLSVDRVRERLAQENVNLTGGRLREGQTEYLVRTINELLRPQDLESIVIENRGGTDVVIADVASVQRGHRDREIMTRVNSAEGVEVSVYKEGGTNTVRVSERVLEGIEALKQRLEKLDPNLEMIVVSDQAHFIRQSISEVLSTAMWGGLLAIGVLYLFLRSFKTTIIIGIAIPISVIATFFCMYVGGISLNIMSLGGLTLGIGLLVDNSIVVLEAIQRRRDRGLSDREAAGAGASEVGRAVVASTLTTICVFVPIVFVEGVAGQLFGDQAMTVTFSLVVSLIVALTVIPMLAARGLGPNDDDLEAVDDVEPTRSFSVAVAIARVIGFLASSIARIGTLLTRPVLSAFQRFFAVIERFYSGRLTWVLDHPITTIVTAILLFAASLSLAPSLGRELVPELIQGEVLVDVELPPGTRLAVTERRLAQIEQRALGHASVASVYAVAGTSHEQGGAAGELRENLGQLTIALTPPISEQREDEVIADLRSVMETDAELDFRFSRPSYFSFKTPLEIEIRGPNLELLERLADQVTTSLSTIEGLTDIKSSTEGGHPELQIRFDRSRLAAYGINISDVASLLRTKVQGTVATEIQRQDRTIDIRVRNAEASRDSVRDLTQLSIHQQGATPIPLSAVAEVTEVEGPAEIRRTESERMALITANLVDRDLGSVATEVTASLDLLAWPRSFDWRIGGQRQEMETSFDTLRLAILLAIFMVYLVMASQFESLLHPLVILFSVPFSAIGVLGVLAALDIRISIVVLIGAILLAGIVVNNAIILVDTTNRFRRRGEAKHEALFRAGRSRLRPILMTTATTVLGLAPMALALGEGAELRSPMAWTVIGGLIASTGLTLLVIPALYSILDRSEEATNQRPV